MNRLLSDNPTIYGGSGMAVLHKGVNDLDWSSAAAAGGWGGSADPLAAAGMSVRAVATHAKSLTPAECYELVVPVHRAVSVRNGQVAQAKVRFFRRNGEEITGGAPVEFARNPAPGMSMRRVVEELGAWLDIAGEMAAWFRPDAKQLIPLAPSCLAHHAPSNPRALGDVRVWQYTFPTDGKIEYLPADQLLFDRLFNPNPASIRGLSPLVTGGAMASSEHYAERWNKTFFENDTAPSGILHLEGPVNKRQREAFEQRLRYEYGAYADNAHKLLVVSGGDGLKFTGLGATVKDAGFIELQEIAARKIGCQLYGVPAYLMGLSDEGEDRALARKQFYETVLLPKCERFSEALQRVFDLHFRGAETHVSRPRGGRLTKAMDAAFEKARDDRPDASILVLLDPDTLPVVADLQLDRSKSAKELKDTYHWSAARAQRWSGIDEEVTKEQEDVWIPSGYVNITHPEMNAMILPGAAAGDGDGGEGRGAPGDNGSGRDGRQNRPGQNTGAGPRSQTGEGPTAGRKKALRRFFRELRSLALESAAAGDCFALADADALAEAHGLDAADDVRLVRHRLKGLDGYDAAKAYLNQVCSTLTP